MSPDAAPRLGLAERLFAWLQYPLPQHLLSRIVHALARVRLRPLKNALIRGFVRLYRVDLAEAAVSDVNDFASFNAFFTRALRAGTRPVAPAPAIVCPVDGGIHAIGHLNGDRLAQVKGREFGLTAFLTDETLARSFRDGEFATLYLAPHNYHRIHMPLDGRLRQMIYVPGRLFSVNAAAARAIPDVFARNERVICEFDTEVGPMLVALVGALFVGSIETVWAGQITPGRPRRLARWTYPHDGAAAPQLARGEELGRFNMGSTVVLLLPAGRVRWQAGLGPGQWVRMGSAFGWTRADR